MPVAGEHGRPKGLEVFGLGRVDGLAGRGLDADDGDLGDLERKLLRVIGRRGFAGAYGALDLVLGRRARGDDGVVVVGLDGADDERERLDAGEELLELGLGECLLLEGVVAALVGLGRVGERPVGVGSASDLGGFCGLGCRFYFIVKRRFLDTNVFFKLYPEFVLHHTN